MIRATELTGRAVVDLDAAEKLGRIDRVIIDPGARRVAAFGVSRGSAMRGNETHTTVPASAVYAIGPDAITVRRVGDSRQVDGDFANLPRATDVIGRRVVSRDGRLLGSIRDVLISGADGHIVGYELADSDWRAALGALFVDRKRPYGPYLRADADLRAGRDLIVAPENAISEPDGEQSKPVAGTVRPSSGADVAVPAADLTSNWFRRDLPKGRMEPHKPVG